MAARRVGIVCGGGDCPGLNAVIRAAVHRAVRGHSMEVVGIEGSFQGLLQHPPKIRTLDLDGVRGILNRGGTIIGTTNRGHPFKCPVVGPDGVTTIVDRSPEIAAQVRAHDLEGLIVLGGEGTLGIAHRLMKERGVPVVGVPKTIDMDVSATDATFGFLSAVNVATDALDRLHSTAESHDRVMVLEVMGRDAGHISLHAGIAGGADVILLPEIPFTMERVAAQVEARRKLGRNFSIIVVAEGTAEAGGGAVTIEGASAQREKVRLGGIGDHVARGVQRITGVESRAIVLGHIQRGGSPAPLDRVLATALGVHAADMAAEGKWGRMASLKMPHVVDVPLEEALGVYNRVDLNGTLVQTARKLGVCMGD